MKICSLNVAKFAVALVALIAAMQSSQAASLADFKMLSGNVNLNDSAQLYNSLCENTPIEPVFKIVPRFAIVDANNKFVFSIGAWMKFTTSYDWGNPVHNPMGLNPGSLQHSLSKDHHLYQMAVGGSGIYFNIIGFPNTANEIGLFISIKMDAEFNNTYRLAASQVYMRYKDLQLGYFSSLYNDLGADAFTIDGAGPAASGAHTTVGMNWQHYFNRHVHVGVGIELPKADYTQIDPAYIENISSDYASHTVSNQYLPNFPFYVGYVWKNGHVRLSAIVKNVHYVNLSDGLGYDCIGNGVKLTGHAAKGPLDFYWMGQIGRASGTSFKGNIGAGMDLVPDNSNPGKLKPTTTWGYIAALQWNITRRHFITLQHSYLRNYIPFYSVPALLPFDKQLRYANSLTANAVWRLSSLFSVGLEYRFVNKRLEGGECLANNRIYTMLQMTF